MALTSLSLLSMAMKRRRFGNGNDSSHPRVPSKSLKLRLFIILPALVTAVALVLAFLCVYAGHTPGMMEDYAVFTLNTSRIGEDLLQDLDRKIESVHLKRRLETVVLPISTVTAAPTTIVTMAPRGLASDLNSELGHATSAIHSAGSVVESKATSVESAAASAASSVTGALATDIVSVVNKAYDGLISDLHLKDFYSIHISTSCSGTYVFQNGTNVTIGDSGLPTPNGAGRVHKHVDECSPHSSLDPMGLIWILYLIGIAFTGIALVLDLVALIIGSSRKLWLATVFATLLAFIFIGLASAVTHGLSLGAARLINFIGNDIGIAGYKTNKFLGLTWTTTVLLLVNVIMCSLLCFFGGKQADQAQQPSGGTTFGFARSRTSPDRPSAIPMKPI